MFRTILVHHHIFKNAGTSFNHALRKLYGKQFLEYDLPRGEVVTQEKLRQFIEKHPACRAISGHHIAFPSPQGKDFQTISSVLLRNPLARIPSIYNFERRQKAQTEGAIKAKELTFKDFVLWRLESNPVVFCNYQTFYCARVNSKSRPAEMDKCMLETALANLSNAKIVGTVERYQDSLSLAQSELRKTGGNIRLSLVHANATGKTHTYDYSMLRDQLVEDLGKHIVAHLERLNEYDIRLYEYADQKLTFSLCQGKISERE